MKRLLAATLCSTAMIAAPAVFAQAGNSGGGDGSTTDMTHGKTTGNTTSPQAPLTPSQTQTSDGAVANPPPLDRSGDAKHVSEKQGGATGHGGTGGQASDGSSNAGDSGAGGGSGSGAGGGAAGSSSGAGGQAGN